MTRIFIFINCYLSIITVIFHYFFFCKTGFLTLRMAAERLAGTLRLGLSNIIGDMGSGFKSLMGFGISLLGILAAILCKRCVKVGTDGFGAAGDTGLFIGIGAVDLRMVVGDIIFLGAANFLGPRSIKRAMGGFFCIWFVILYNQSKLSDG
jgi:hypothetical protein